jgi:hypothetical protein
LTQEMKVIHSGQRSMLTISIFMYALTHDNSF